MKDQPKRILVKEVNWLGDIVMSLPALKAVRASYPDAKISLLIKKELASFFDGASWLNEVIPYAIRKGWAGWGDRRRLVSEIRAKNFDLAVLFPNSFESAFWMRWAGIPERVGYARDGRGFLLSKMTKPSPEILEVHQVGYYLNMLKLTLGLEGSKDEYVPDVLSSSQAKMRTWIQEHHFGEKGNIIALAVAAAYGPAKEWPEEYYAELIDRLKEKWGACCVLVGAPGERPKCEAVAGSSRAGAMVAAGETSVGEALALLSICDGFAGNDSGSMHVAGALGLPTVGIYGSTRADRTGPLGPKTRILYQSIACSPCLKRTCMYGHYDCLKNIKPVQVLEALEGLGVFK